MTQHDLSHIANLVLAMIYAVIAALATAAWRLQIRNSSTRIVCWSCIAAIFAGLVAWRILGLESLMLTAVRHWAHTRATYDDRRLIQVPAVYAVMLALYFALRRCGGGMAHWRQAAPQGASLALLALTALRTVSLHQTDQILYAAIGPLHVTHILELGCAAVVGACAIRDQMERPDRRAARELSR